MKRSAGWLFVALCTIFVDQSVKLCSTNTDRDLVINRGIGFGLFGESLLPGILLSLFGLGGVVYLIISLLNSKQTKRKNIYLILLGVILGAGSSNLLDKVVRGGVVDFIRLGFIPNFNIADLLITVSVLALVGLTLFDVLNERAEKRI